MDVPTFKRVGAGEPARYEVRFGDEVVGTVAKYERRYNLRRLYVARGWRATTADGRKLYQENGSTSELRRDAAMALVAAR